MDYVKISRALLPLLGGKANIASAAHCATRLRLVLADDALADTAAIGRIEGGEGVLPQCGTASGDLWHRRGEQGVCGVYS